MGNLYAESGLKPGNLQNSYEKSLGMNDAQYVAAVDSGAYTNFVKDSAGFGLAQWTYWSRKQNLLQFAKARKASIADLNMQILQLDLQGIQEREGSGSQAYKMKSLEIEAAALEKSQKTELRDQEIAELNSQIEALRKKTEAQTLTAPHAGQVYYDDSIKNGAFVRALKTVMTIADPEELKFVVPEAVDNRIMENGSARAWILGKEWELEYVPLSGDERLSYIKRNQIPPTFFNVKTPDKDHELYAGLSGALLGETWKLEDVLYVPVNALLKDGGQNYVYVIRDGTRTRKDVKTGYTNGVNTIITEGLEEGEIIYVKE